MGALLWALALVALHLAGWGGAWLDLPALALVSLGWGMRLEGAILASWGLGLFLDASSLGLLGVQALAWMAGAGALAVEQRSSHRAETPTLMLAALLSAAWLGLASSLGNPEWGTFLARASVTGLAAPILLWPLRRAWVPRRASR